jgi:transcriptional regulator with XRE-family HTH domain
MNEDRCDANKRFAADIDRLRLSREWSVDELARRSGLETDELRAILRGEDEVPLDAIVILARTLDVPPGDLIDGTV